MPVGLGTCMLTAKLLSDWHATCERMSGMGNYDQYARPGEPTPELIPSKLEDTPIKVNGDAIYPFQMIECSHFYKVCIGSEIYVPHRCQAALSPAQALPMLPRAFWQPSLCHC